MKRKKTTRADKIAASAVNKPVNEASSPASAEMASQTDPAEASKATPDPVNDLAQAIKDQMGHEDTIFKIVRNPHTMEDDAYVWANSPTAIAGVPFAPIQFVGRRCLKQLFDFLKRPLTLQELRFLVQADGKMETCWVTRKQFQPVKYVPFLSREAETDMAGDKPLTETRQYFGGAFKLFFGRLLATSGSVYEPNGEDYCKGSPLVIAERAFAKDSRRENDWPECRQQIAAYLENKVGRIARIKSYQQTIADAMADMKKHRGPDNLNSVLEALTSAGNKGNGSH